MYFFYCSPQNHQIDVRIHFYLQKNTDEKEDFFKYKVSECKNQLFNSYSKCHFFSPTYANVL